MAGIPSEVYNAANPFANFDRMGGWSDYDEENQQQQQHQLNQQHADNNSNPQQQHHNHQQQQPMSPEKTAAVAAALSMSSEADREAALRRLYGEFGGPAPNAFGGSPPRRAGSQGGSSQRSQGDANVADSPMHLVGGASSLEELLSRAAALDRECFDLQNEVTRWEHDIVECEADVERVSKSCTRYAAELGQVEASVAELNQWFQEHTCANDPERYDRLGEVNRDVCGLRLRITSLEQQLETLLQGTLTTTQFGDDGQGSAAGGTPIRGAAADGGDSYSSVNRSRSAAAGGGGNNNPDSGLNDDTQRIADMLNMISPNRSGSMGGNNNADRSGSSMHPVASPVRLPQNASTSHLKRYIAELEHKTLEQDVLILRLKEAASKRDRLLQQERENEMEIQQLRAKLENAGIALPVAPIPHRTSRTLRKNQSHTAASVAMTNGSDVSRRTIRLPSGVLRDLTKELSASVRQVAHRCGVGEIAVEIANDATLLHCRGVLRAVNAFEDEVTAAADRCKRQRALGGLVTYAVPEVAAVIADSTDKIAQLLQPSRQHGDSAANSRGTSGRY